MKVILNEHDAKEIIANFYKIDVRDVYLDIDDEREAKVVWHRHNEEDGEEQVSKITVKKKTSNFTILDNTALRDDKLSWKAKGLLAYLLHLPDDWKINVEDLKNRSKDGRDSTNNAIKELVENGYILRTRNREGGRFKSYDYDLFETPQTENTVTENPLRENHYGKTVTENPELLSTKKLKTKVVSTNRVSTNKTMGEIKINIPFEIFWDLYDKKISKPKCVSKWKLLTNKDREDIIEFIPRYKENQPNKVYRKDPYTFFNSRTWEDEIIEFNNKGYKKKEEKSYIDKILSGEVEETDNELHETFKDVTGTLEGEWEQMSCKGCKYNTDRKEIKGSVVVCKRIGRKVIVLEHYCAEIGGQDGTRGIVRNIIGWNVIKRDVKED